MTNLELLNYALAGVNRYETILKCYEQQSEQTNTILNNLKSDKKRIESMISDLSENKDRIVKVL